MLGFFSFMLLWGEMRLKHINTGVAYNIIHNRQLMLSDSDNGPIVQPLQPPPQSLSLYTSAVLPPASLLTGAGGLQRSGRSEEEGPRSFDSI